MNHPVNLNDSCKNAKREKQLIIEKIPTIEFQESNFTTIYYQYHFYINNKVAVSTHVNDTKDKNTEVMLILKSRKLQYLIKRCRMQNIAF